MTNNAIGFLIHRFLFRVSDFFHHWYVDGSRHIVHYATSWHERADRIFAIKVTTIYFFKPLYKDYSVVGRFLGIVFRSIRIITGSIFYLLLGAVFLILYLIWISTPFAFLIVAYYKLIG